MKRLWFHVSFGKTSIKYHSYGKEIRPAQLIILHTNTTSPPKKNAEQKPIGDPGNFPHKTTQILIENTCCFFVAAIEKKASAKDRNVALGRFFIRST